MSSFAAEANDSQRMIRDSVGAIAPRGGDLKRIRALRFTPPCADPAVWREMAALGWLAARVPEVEEGLGLGVRELALIAEELGAGLVPEPIMAATIIAPLVPLELREPVLAGRRIVLPAWQEQPDGFDAAPQTAFAGGRLSGCKILIPTAGLASAFLVTTAAGLALVDREADGVSLALRQTQDGGQFGLLRLKDAPAIAISGDFAAALRELTLVHSAYLLGASERAFQMTLDYLNVRKQFGRLIGSFQALQHRAADMKIQLAVSRAVLEEAIATEGGPQSVTIKGKALSRAKARVADTAMLIARESIQMHGAIGVTDACDIGLYARKILTDYNLYGSANSHRALYLKLSEAERRG